MIKDIVVSLSLSTPRDIAADYAISLAESVGARLSGVAFAYEPVPSPAVMGGVPTEFIGAQRAESDRAAQAAINSFEQAAKRAGLTFEARRLEATVDGAATLFGRIARRFDLSVVAQGEPDVAGLQEALIEAALFESGRPILVVPYIQRTPFSVERVMVCWDGGRTAARALADALPLLARAKSVEVVIVQNDPGKSDEIPGADIGEHLARHGLDVSVERIPAVDIDVANALLSHAADISADFIVMGGYGHSRLREFVLGGATRGMLSSMTVPVLMSH